MKSRGSAPWRIATLVNLLGDVGDGDAVGVGDPLLERERRRLERLERAARRREVEAHLAAREGVGVEDPHQQASVGDRRLACRRARSRPAPDPTPALPGPTRTSPECEIETIAAAARADARDLGRERVDDQVVLELEGVVDERLAADHQRDVGRGPADVAADQVGLAHRLAQRDARHRAGGGAGEDDPKRLLERLVPGQQRRRAIGEVERAGEAVRAQLRVELVRVAREDQLHEDVDRPSSTRARTPSPAARSRRRSRPAPRRRAPPTPARAAAARGRR